MENLNRLIDEIADACYFDVRDSAKEGLSKLVDFLLVKSKPNEVLLFLLNQINYAMEANDYCAMADYLVYGLKALVNNENIPESLLYPYSELIPNNDEPIFYLPSFLDKELVLCMRKGEKTIRFNSLYSPKNEAEYYVNHQNLKKYTPVVCIFGIGTGLIIEKILENLSKDSKLIIYEPDERILDYCNNSAKTQGCSIEEELVFERLKRIINDERVYLHIEKDSKTSFQVVLDSYVDYTGIAGLVHLINTGYAEAYSSCCLKFYQELKEYRIRLLTNINTELLFMDDYIEYSFRNIPLCTRLNLASELVKVVKTDIPSVIVSAGPSLNKNIEVLRKIKGHFFIVAVDTALQYLLKRDIIPDLWVTIDPKKPIDFFKDERSYDIPCVFKSTANSDILNRVKRVFLLDGERDYLELLIESLGIQISNPYGSGGSVATTSFALLYSLGIKNIILIGQDLAYLGDTSHADGANDGVAYETTFVDGFDGKPVKTRRDWLNYLKWFEQSIEMINTHDFGITVIDATEGGAKIHGSKTMTLNEAIESLKNDKGLLPDYCFADEIEKLPFLFDEQQYKKLCVQHKTNVDKIRAIETDSYEAYNMCKILIKQIKENNASDAYIYKENKKISNLRKKIEQSPIFYIISRYAQNFTYEIKAQLELKEGGKKDTQINLLEIMKLTFDSYVKASNKIYTIAKKYENEV